MWQPSCPWEGYVDGWRGRVIDNIVCALHGVGYGGGVFVLSPNWCDSSVVNIYHVSLEEFSSVINLQYRKTSNISRTLVGNKIVDNSDVVGASPVGAAPTTSSFST